MPEPQIIDTTVIQVKSTTTDIYNNLIVTPIEGEDIKVSVKRRSLFDIFQQGDTVKLFWAEYMHKKFVARAERETSPVSPSAEKIVSSETKHQIAPQERGISLKDKSICLSYAKDLLCNGVIEREELYRCAEEMVDWLNKDVV